MVWFKMSYNHEEDKGAFKAEKGDYFIPSYRPWVDEDFQNI